MHPKATTFTLLLALFGLASCTTLVQDARLGDMKRAISLSESNTGAVKHVVMAREDAHLNILSERAAPCPLKQGNSKPQEMIRKHHRKHKHHKGHKHHHHGKPKHRAHGNSSKKPASKPKSTKKTVNTQKKQHSGSSSGSHSSGSSSGSSSSIESQMLQVHNSLRAKHNASPVSWNAGMAAKAQTWANRCVFEHSGGSLGPWGESDIAAGYQSATAAAQGWADEEKYWRKGGGFSAQTGHYTQMVWKKTTQIGCAVAQCSGMLGQGSAPFYVCEYNPPGNYQGEYDQNVN